MYAKLYADRRRDITMLEVTASKISRRLNTTSYDAERRDNESANAQSSRLEMISIRPQSNHATLDSSTHVIPLLIHLSTSTTLRAAYAIDRADVQKSS
uniref:Uncharacterized protein n=1 Tax=Mycena chlorophos TaxID=658473 RepID=A0ABQ0M2P0_MYCCL|nr:predicted protein [Mycena chlorophos]